MLGLRDSYRGGEGEGSRNEGVPAAYLPRPLSASQGGSAANVLFGSCSA